MTELEDSSLVQVLDCVPFVRRSRALGSTTGIFHNFLLNEHGAGGTTLQSSIDPYNPGSVFSVRPYPITVPRRLDIFIIGAVLFGSSGTMSNFNVAILSALTPASAMGWGIDDGGSAVAAANGQIFLARWDVINNEMGVQDGMTEQGLMYQPIGLRLRRGQTLTFDSNASGTVSARCLVLTALMPAGLGQDVSV